ncbi:MAG: hypothetical protein BWY85_02221 [Firmicutes bacterium ADurb.Bin506]|nr:MAG: hypothetical protein BWY85_02221 [Firmicutes bacterium ADurb.Bin506]
MLCNVSVTAASEAAARPSMARACSRATGFLFCGIMLDICTIDGSRERAPTSLEDQNIRSVTSLPRTDAAEAAVAAISMPQSAAEMAS